jgi:hypothetical protein
MLMAVAIAGVRIVIEKDDERILMYKELEL